MLRVLLLVALIAATRAYVEEFSNENLRREYIFDPTPVNAEFLKPKKPQSFERGRAERPNAITLFPLQMPDEPVNEGELCGQYHGVRLLDSEELFCQISRLTLATNTRISDFEQIFYLNIGFDEGFSNPNFRLVVPIMQIPYDSDPNAEDELHAKPGLQWARDNQVALLDFDDDAETALQRIPPLLITTNPATINFEWLGQLLEYGIFRFPPGNDRHCYLTRPVVMPLYLIENFLQVIVNIHRPRHRFYFHTRDSI